MPKKACCCNQQISWPTSCCKPPENKCVGSTINISVDVYVKFYCQPNGNILIWKCSDGSESPIDFETEHWRLNLTYTLSEDDVVPPIPSVRGILYDDSRNLNYYENDFIRGNSASLNYYGALGYVGGIFPYSWYVQYNSGDGSVLGSCTKCINPCEANNLVQNCQNFSYTNDSGELITGCGIGGGAGNGGGFGGNQGAGFWYVVDCGSCCHEDINYTINYKEDEYHACDVCNFGGPYLTEERQGAYSIGVKTIDNQPEWSIFGGLLSTDISLRDSASWTFDFIPSYQGHTSKLNIELLSCHLGCADIGRPGVYLNQNELGANQYYNDYTHLVDIYDVKNYPPRTFSNICKFPGGPCGITLSNPNLFNVCLEMTQYYNPPWYMGIQCNNPFDPCACITGFNGSVNCPGGGSNNVVQIPTQPQGPLGFNTYDKYFLTNCGCCCGVPGTCHRWFHNSADPDTVLRPHELSIELGIGYRNTAPCGEEIEMDFYEELYRIDYFDPLITPVKIEKTLTAPNGVRYVNPEWIDGVQYAGNEEVVLSDFSYYNYYSQGMRMKLTYTRNSIPYEKYNHNNVDNFNCVPETIVGEILDYPAKNKRYPEYPTHGHPNMSDHPQGIYEGEYALSKVSYWTPSVNATNDTASQFPSSIMGNTYGAQQANPPVGVTAFHQCYPFNTMLTQTYIVPYPYTTPRLGNIVDTDDPLSKQGYPFTYQYSYGDITAVVTQIG